MTKKTAALIAAPMMFLLLTAESCGPNKNSSAQTSQRITESYQQKLTAAVPYPLDAMKDSIERRNLRERLLRFNKPDKIGYVYLLSDTGSVVAFYTIKGKITSTESQLTNSDSTECHNGCSSPVLRQAPGDDGSYGPSEPGIFFFTTEDVLVQWNGKFVYADAPLKVSSTPLLVETPGAKPTSTGGG